ncbi:MAG: NADH-quinone oxidoreductase subunit NuoK [Candidatus Caenarcaniphilales bacterium]|nr:NADH-quinone oxidoreductase subunit NuoK [Candidatus Caenarcaniphilales bacterium]
MENFFKFIDRISQPLLLITTLSLAWSVILLQHSPLTKCLTLAGALFCIGLYGVLSSKSVIKTLISLEMLFNAANINLIAFSKYTDLTFVRGQVFSLFVMAVAAAEVALGLALVIAIYRLRQTSSLKKLNQLNG